MAHRAAAGTLMFEVHLSYACNLSCKDCNRGIGLTAREHTPNMTPETYEAWLRRLPDILKRKRHLKVIFTGGEPTLLPDLEEYVKLTLRVAPMAKMFLATNEYEQASQDTLQYLSKTYGITNVGSAKPEAQPAYAFLEGQFVSPQDIGRPRSEPCPWSVRCGVSVDSKGMTGCAMGGAVDGLLRLDQRTWNFMELTDERLMNLCAHCGAWDIDPSTVDPTLLFEWRGHKVSKTWLDALRSIEE